MRTTALRCLAAAFLLSNAANAALVDRGGGLIYDSDLNITWLKDANYAMTSGYPYGGRMTMDNAMTWVANLSYYDSVRNVTYSDWRLPYILQPDPACEYQNSTGSYGRYCTGSEMGHLFYNELGGQNGISLMAEQVFPTLVLTGLSSYYWSSTEDGLTAAWFFSFDGVVGISLKDAPMVAWAVRDGDVAAVPVPATAWLLGSGMLGLVGVARRKAV